MGRRVGVFGGTFDPIHIGHLVAATEVRAALNLDIVVLMVAAEPWQKVGVRKVSPAADRLAVARSALQGVPGIEVSSAEVDRGGPTYTADTLAELKRDEPDAEVFLIVGADVAADLDSWMRLDEVRASATLVVVGRPGSAVRTERLVADGWSVVTVDIPGIDVSSSDLRARRATGRPIDVMVPPAAVREIENRGLYAPT